MIEAGLVALLNANAPLMALIDPSIYPVFVPPTHLDPCLSYQGVSGKPSYTFEGRQSLEKCIEFNAWSETGYAACRVIMLALRNALDGFSGTLTDGTKVRGTFRGETIDFYESDSRSYRVMQEYIFRFIEP